MCDGLARKAVADQCWSLDCSDEACVNVGVMHKLLKEFQK